MEEFSKRLLSLVLTVFMIVSMVPASVFAVETAAVVNETTGATFKDLASAVREAGAGNVIVVNTDINSMPSIDEAITIKGAEGADVQVNCVIAENFPNVDGTVTFENLTFNERISTENNSSDQSKLNLAFYNCDFNVKGQYAIQGGSTANTPGNDVLGGLYVAECTFTATSETFVGNYMIYAQCVNSLTVKNSDFIGNGLYKGAIHTGDSTEQATVADFNQNTFTGFSRGVQIGNRVEGSAVTLRENTFESIVASDSEKKSGAIYVHGNANAQTTDIEITDNAINGSELAVYNDGHSDLRAFLTGVSGNTADGAAIAMVTNDAGHISASASAPIPALPTATVTEIDNKDLTFALNFKADEVNPEQLAYYGDWYADFVLTINKDVTFNSDGTVDGYLSGQYDGWSKGWVNVPYGESVTLEANTPLKIMEYATKLMGYKNKLTYAAVYNDVQDFNCGVFFSKEFLDANPDLEVTLELRMYNPADETESYVIGETYDFSVPALPTATVTEIENDELTFALNFKADEATEEQLAYYGDWYADYVLTINKDVTFYTGEGADGYLSGQYDAWSENWVDVPYNKAVNLAANTSLKIMEYAAELMGKPGLKYTYAEVYNSVKDFDCGVFFTDEFLAANPDLEVTLELRMFNPADETESYIIGETYVFTLEEKVIAENTNSGNTYATVSQALALAQKGETVRLLVSTEEEYLTIAPGRTLDLNGNTLTVESINSAYKATHIIDSTNGDALLKVEDRDSLAIRSDNAQLPVWIEGESGFRFASASFAQKAGTVTVGGVKKAQFKFYLKGEQADYLIANELSDGSADNDGLTFRIKMTCTNNSGTETEYFFTFPESNAVDYGEGWPNKMMFVNIAGLEDVEEVTFSAMICYDKTVVSIAGDPVTY